ncbi:MAG TPA: EamA family transporter [Hyphomicrobiaceae bacterium]|nr:EamA family transporter [Hyphomicrobiaceae bacterium]
MEATVFLAVLAAAAFHAGWNAILKIRLEPLLAMSLIAAASGLVALPFLPIVDVPHPDSWLYLLASLIIHFVYYIALAEAYRTGDLGQVYPIARGTAPLLTAVGASLWLDEHLGWIGWCGILVLAGGIMLLSFRGGRDVRRIDRRAIAFALVTAASIALYTLADGIGARLAGPASSYIVWMFVLDGLMMLTFGLLRFPKAMVSEGFSSWALVLAGGALSCAAYAIAIWAMTKAPIALVAALRETSVLFAAMIGIAWLREPVMATRLVAALLVVAGMVLVRLR